MLTARTTGKVLGSRVEVATLRSAADNILAMAKAPRSQYVCFTTAYMLVLAARDPEVHRTYERATMITADGMPIAWALRLLGYPEADCISGPRLTPILLKDAAKLGLRVGFYGGRQETLDRMQAALAHDLPSLQVTYIYSPPFRPLIPDEQQSVAAAIRAAGVQMLFVGLGSPKQDHWMRDQSAAIECVSLGVGAAFEFLSGEKVPPTVWMQTLGLAWLVRLCQEPRRLARRNLYSPIFVGMFALQWIFGVQFDRFTSDAEAPAAKELIQNLIEESPAE